MDTRLRHVTGGKLITLAVIPTEVDMLSKTIFEVWFLDFLVAGRVLMSVEEDSQRKSIWIN